MDRSSRPLASFIRRVWELARRHWIISTIGVAAAIGLGVWLIFFFFAVQTLFVDDEVDEAVPTFGSSEPAAPAPAPAPEPEPAAPPTDAASDAPAPAAPAPAASDAPTPAPAAPAASDTSAPPPAPPADAASDAPAPTPPADASDEFLVAGPGASGMPGDEITQERADAMNEAMASGAMPLEVIMEEERPMPVAPQIVTLVSGEFASRSHETSGRALVLNDGSEQRFLRFEDFRTDNGPDVNIYLSSAPPDAPARDFALDFVDLGDMKGNVGAQNYEIPPSVDLDHYSTVVVWCVRFSVAFGVAGLS